MEAAINVEGITKQFGGRTVVKELAFTVKPGEIFGFLGPNGAGKTTSIRMMIGELRPDEGRIDILGRPMPAERDQIKALIGVIPDHQNLYDRLTTRQNLELFSRLYDCPAGRVDEVIDQVQLGEHRDVATLRLSRGLRQRVLIARGLLHRPRLLFLDEPTSALDPHSALIIRSLVSRLREDGATVLLTTHYMEEANSLCDRLAIMHHGHLVAIDTPQALRLQHGRPLIAVDLEEAGQPPRRCEIPLNDPVGARQLADWLSAGVVRRLHSQEASLEEVFLNLTGSAWKDPLPEPPAKSSSPPSEPSA
jgi:ABC-2 type transport system ATP-binding protein